MGTIVHNNLTMKLSSKDKKDGKPFALKKITEKEKDKLRVPSYEYIIK